MLVISDAQSFGFDIGHVAYRAVGGKVGDDGNPFARIVRSPTTSPSPSLTAIVDTDKLLTSLADALPDNFGAVHVRLFVACRNHGWASEKSPR